MPTCSASASVLALYLIVRGENFYRKTFFACPCVVTLFGIVLPLFVTNTLSYGAARKVCYDWTVERLNEALFDDSSPPFDPEWDMQDAANWHLLPSHLFTSASTVASLFGFWVWLFFSPHINDVTRDLDRTCTNPIVFL
jgi:hypothetical protein